MQQSSIPMFLADDNLIVREGVRALLSLEEDLQVVGVAADYGGTVMQFVGDAVLAVFGAPVPQTDSADGALASALAMHEGQTAVDERWKAEGLEPFGLSIGLSPGPVAAALLGFEERLEYSVVGDTPNLTQRIQEWAAAGQTVLSQATYKAVTTPAVAEALEPALAKGRQTPVSVYRLRPAAVP